MANQAPTTLAPPASSDGLAERDRGMARIGSDSSTLTSSAMPASLQ